MSSRAQLVSLAVEDALRHRVAAPFAPAQRTLERRPLGIAALDEVLGGGVPIGAITELVGPASSGRVTTALRLVAELTRQEAVCAWVDVSDALDPESAAGNGVDLARLLWVRCGGSGGAEAAGAEPQPAVAARDERVAYAPAAAFGRGSPHPRSEGRHMPEAIASMLSAPGAERRARRVIGTPGAPNRPLEPRSREREEQVATDRLPPRRGELLLSKHCHARDKGQFGLDQKLVRAPGAGKGQAPARAQTQAWREATGKAGVNALDQGLRATDLLLANAGFSAIVLDLGGVPVEWAWKIPLATWFRFRAACERSRTTLLLLTEHGCARSSAELVVRLRGASLAARGAVMTGVCFEAEAERSRFSTDRKAPARAANWSAEAAWA